MRARNEAAVREEIVAPLLAALGYRSGTLHDILYELSLRYPKDFLGRKKNHDPDLRGKADYICLAGGKVPWTIEAKAEEPGITRDDVEQAYTYAKHPEVRAVYFCLCDGNEFRVYATEATPDMGLVRCIPMTSASESARALESLLGPTSLLTRFALVMADALPPIGPGLHSFAQITGGSIAYDDSNALPILRGFTISVTGGAIQRLDDGRLHAYWEGQAPYASIQRAIRALGLTRAEAFSSDSQLSSDSNSPTVFVTEATAVFPQGQRMLDLVHHEEVELPRAMKATVSARASGTLFGDRFRGPYELRCVYAIEEGSTFADIDDVHATGTFEFALR